MSSSGVAAPFSLATVDNGAGWTSTIVETSGRFHLDAGQSIDVRVAVSPPLDARLGDTNSTRLLVVRDDEATFSG